MKNKDRRFRKTEKVLDAALAELLIHKELQNITIQELTDRADIHRSTFYKHYQDIYDLYERLEKRVMKDMEVIMSQDPSHTYDSLYCGMMDYIYQHPAICKMLFSENGNPKFHKKLKHLLEEKYIHIWLYEDNKKIITEEMRYMTAYNIQGCMAILERWIESDFAYPKEKILGLLRDINAHLEKIML